MTRMVSDLLMLAKLQRPDFLALETIDVATLTEELRIKAAALGAVLGARYRSGHCPRGSGADLRAVCSCGLAAPPLRGRGAGPVDCAGDRRGPPWHVELSSCPGGGARFEIVIPVDRGQGTDTEVRYR
jgi:hypothetical protein